MFTFCLNIVLTTSFIQVYKSIYLNLFITFIDFSLLEGETMATTNDEHTEAAHAQVRRQEELHNLKMKKQLSGRKKGELSAKTMSIINKKNSKFKKRY